MVFGTGYDTRFERAVDFVLSHEGGYVNDPRDPGGETKFGISKRSYPELDISLLTEVAAKGIYHRDFWVKPNIRHLDNDTLATKVFDFAVNAGAKTSILRLQRAVNRAIGCQFMKEDGVCGAHTLSTVNCQDSARVLGLFINECSKHYWRLSKKDPTFIRGWLERLMDFI